MAKTPRVEWRKTDPKTHSFRGRRFKINVRRIKGKDGEASKPGWPYKWREIALHKSMRESDLLETLVHEALHVCLPDLNEETVTESARDIARFLGRFGFKR